MKRYMLIIMTVISLALAGLMLGTTTPAYSEPAPTQLLVSPETSVSTTCAPHTIAIAVENVESLAGHELKIKFNPSVVAIISVENGDFLSNPEEQLLYSPANNDGEWNDDGYIIFGLVQQGEDGNPEPRSGTGTLVEITMQALAPDLTTNFDIDTEATQLIWWGEDGSPTEPGDPLDGSLIEYTASHGVVHTDICPPLAQDQVVNTLIDSSVAIELTGTDFEGLPLDYYLVPPYPQFGTLSGGPLPGLIYTPLPDFIGTDSFSFVVYNGRYFSQPATVTINVREPVAMPEEIVLSNNTILEGEPIATEIGTFSTLPDDGVDYVYTLVAGGDDDDNASFTIDGNQLLSAEVFDSTLQSFYTIRVRCEDPGDGSRYLEKVFTIEVEPESEFPFKYYLPLITR